MNWFRSFGFGRRKRELQEELEAHLQMAIADRVERGETEQAARQAALREFGNIALVQEVTRSTWGWSNLECLAHDVRYALRQLRKTPGFTVTAILTLALGIGANVAIFSLIYSAMLRSLPVPHPEELVSLQAHFAEVHSHDLIDEKLAPLQRNGMYKALSGQHALDGLCGLISGRITDSTEDQPVHIGTAEVTGGCFSTLEVVPLLGRLITPADDTPEPGPQGFAAVISYAWWNARYHRDPSVIGKKLVVQDIFSRPRPIVIVGVLPPDFHGLSVGDNPRMYMPAYFSGAENRDVNSNISMLLFGRLKKGETVDRAEAELQPLFQNWLREAKMWDVTDHSHTRLILKPDAAGYSGVAQVYGKALRLLQMLVATILISGCLYLSSLFSARATVRRHEFAVRAALGASRARLMAQSMIESALLVGAGGIAGIFVAWGSASYLIHFISRSSVPLLFDVRPQGWILVSAAVVSLLALVLTGLLPAWRASKPNVITDIKEFRLGVPGVGRRRLGSMLFPLQVALSLVVIVVSSLLSASLLRALTQDNGFRLSGSVFVSTDIPMVLPEQDKDHKKLRATLAMYDDLLEELNHTPGIRSASADVTHPLGGSLYGADASSQYRSLPGDSNDIPFAKNWIAPRYFETAGTHMLAGREFSRNDTQGTLPVCVLSESAARYFFPSISPLGQVLTEKHYSSVQKLTVVGVVEDTRFRGLESNAPMMLYLPINQTPDFLRSVEFLLRTDDVGGAVSALRKLVHDRTGAHVMEVTPVSDAVKESLSRTRLLTTLSNTFAALALLLSAIGIFGLLNYSVSQRVNEIGVRMALGASRTRVIAMVLSQAAALVVPGVVLGIAGALAATRFIASLLYQTKPLDPVAFSVSIFALLLASAISSYLPARRAARIEPMEALRAE